MPATTNATLLVLSACAAGASAQVVFDNPWHEFASDAGACSQPSSHPASTTATRPSAWRSENASRPAGRS